VDLGDIVWSTTDIDHHPQASILEIFFFIPFYIHFHSVATEGPSNWKHSVATACESFQSGIQTWRKEGGLL